MGYGDVSYYNKDSKINTTNIDALASDGVVFTDAHTSSSVSTPSRYSLLTGRYPWRSVKKQGVLGGYSESIIDGKRKTLANMLKDKGYSTACIGKWHLGWTWNNVENGIEKIDYSKPISDGPIDKGFDYFFGISASLDMPPYVYVENDMPTQVPVDTTENTGKYSWWRKGPTSPDFKHKDVLANFVNRACDYIDEYSQKSNPYFLYLPLPSPHTPILPDSGFYNKSGISEYVDYVMMVDSLLGKVLETVRNTGEEDNTIFIFTTDNGAAPAINLDEHKSKGYFPNYVFRGCKHDLYEGGHRVPCIVRWPDKFKHKFVDQTICLSDFYSTLAAVSGYEVKDNEAEDSYNILPLMESDDFKGNIREAIVHHSALGEFAIRKGDWKLLLSPSSGGWSYPQPNDSCLLSSLPLVQLYNLKDDIREKNNVYDEYPEIVIELKQLLKKYIEEGRSTEGLPQKNDGEYPWKQLYWMNKIE